MASGKNHDLSTFFCSPLVFVGTLTATEDMVLSIGVTGTFLFGGLFLSPDLDCPSRPYHRWTILKFIWVPYQMIPHRNFLSHGLIIGSLGRILYLGGWVFLINALVKHFSGIDLLAPLWLVELSIKHIEPFRNEVIRKALWLFGGVEASAFLHYNMDNLYGLLPRFIYNRLK